MQDNEKNEAEDLEQDDLNEEESTVEEMEEESAEEAVNEEADAEEAIDEIEEDSTTEEVVEESAEDDLSEEESVVDADNEESEAGDQTEADESQAADVVEADETPADTDSKSGDAVEAVPVITEATVSKKKRNYVFPLIIIVAVVLVVLLLVLTNKPGANVGGGTTIAADAVARVGDTIITQEMVDSETALILYNNYGQSIDTLTPEEQTIFKNQILVFFLVQAEAIKEDLRAAGKADLSEEQIEAVAQSVETYFGMIENADEVLGAMGITREVVQYFAEINEYMSLFKDKVIEETPVTDAEIEQFYNENQEYFISPYQISASHILIMDADHTPEKRAEMEAVLQRLDAGEDFAELAMELSEDPGSAQSGGDVGYFGEDHGFVPEFGAAALALENIGDVSEIIETDYGYHIIKLTDKQDESIQPLDTVASTIREYLENILLDEKAAELLDIIEIEYFVEVDPATGMPPIDPPAVDAEAIPEAIE